MDSNPSTGEQCEGCYLSGQVQITEGCCKCRAPHIGLLPIPRQAQLNEESGMVRIETEWLGKTKGVRVKEKKDSRLMPVYFTVYTFHCLHPMRRL